MKSRPLVLTLAISSFLLAWMTPWARADVLVGINGERFVGTVVSATATNVVFESELGGRLTFSRTKIRELQQTPPAAATFTTLPVLATNPPATQIPTNAAAWKPPGVGHDGADWVQLKSGEWLRGQLKYVQDKEVEFDSDEMELQTLKLKDVKMVYTAHRVFTRFENRPPVLGMVVVSNNVVMVNGSEPLALPREQLIGITPGGGQRGLRNWSGDASLSTTLQSGNNHQSTVSASAELARRTPDTTLLLNYLGNYGELNGIQSADNDRVNGSYDIRFSHDWFARPIQFEYYYDPLANVQYRLTAGVGAGYYIFDRPNLEWTVSAGPGYQTTRFSTVEIGQSETASTVAGVINSRFNADITKRLTFIQTWQSSLTSKESGLYTHHAVTSLEFEIKRHLDLDVSLVWDYLQNPQVRSDGVVPQKSDLYLTVGFGVKF